MIDTNLAQLIDHMGSDLTVVNAARVSMGKHKTEFDNDDKKLIGYLAKNGHWTPFSHPQIQLRLKMPIFVARQWTRSTVGLTINEISRRYVDSEPEFFVPNKWRARPEKNIKQGSGKDLSTTQQQQADFTFGKAMGYCHQAYLRLLDLGVCPEQARILLPQGAYTEFYQTGSLYAFARICKQRLDNHSQKEIQDYARLVFELIEPLYPISWQALMNSGD